MREPTYEELVVEETAIADAQEEVARVMQEDGVLRSQLADRLGVSRARVTQMLGGANVSMRVLARTADALGYKVEIKLVKKGR